MSENMVKELSPKDWTIAAVETFLMLTAIEWCVYGFAKIIPGDINGLIFRFLEHVSIFNVVGILFSPLFGYFSQMNNILVIWKKVVFLSICVFGFLLILFLLSAFICVLLLNHFTGLSGVALIVLLISMSFILGVYICPFVLIYTRLMVHKAKKLEKA